MFQTLNHKKTHAPSLARLFTPALFAALAFITVAATARVASAQPAVGSPDLVISQVYTRGGEPGSAFQNDFIEIFNRGNVTVDLTAYTIMVLTEMEPDENSPGGLITLAFLPRPGTTLAPGQYYLYQFGRSGDDGEPLPTPDEGRGTFLNPSPLAPYNLPSTTSRVAIVKGVFTEIYTLHGCAVGVDAAVADFFSYGAATCVEGGTNFPAPSPATAALRNTDGCDDTDNNVADFSTAAPTPRNSAAPLRPCNFPAPAGSVQFETSTATVSEGAGFAEIFVTRSGATGAAASVQYATNIAFQFNIGFGASDLTDYTTTLGTLDFAPGETRKSFRVLITNDARSERGEPLTLSLNYPTGGVALGPRHIMRLTIDDDDATNGANPIDTTDFFVRQHYADFLSREPDTTGFNFWKDEIEGCNADAQCREVKRINVSAAFFVSIEFQDTGFYAYRAYKASFPDSGSRLRGFPLYRELWRDARRIGRGVVVGEGAWEQQLAANKQAYALEFVTRPEFVLRYPASRTPAQFVDLLNATAGNPLSQAERDQQVANLTASGNGTAGRAAVLASVVEDADFKAAEFNRAFVLAQYFGYMRRNPSFGPDTDFTGFDFWLTKLNEFNGNYVAAEMVKAFISSDEYRNRFVQ
ncbi:MAG TPA: Calx-beta domain-containing protein [Pyrinomonadaceae bacterium]